MGRTTDSMTREERRREIILTLCRRGRETRENLAFEFGVTKRTIEIDVMNLSLSYPVYTRQGGGGGIFIDEDYVPDMKFYTKKQLELSERLLERLAGEDRAVMLSMIKTFAPPKRGNRS